MAITESSTVTTSRSSTGPVALFTAGQVVQYVTATAVSSGARLNLFIRRGATDHHLARDLMLPGGTHRFRLPPISLSDGDTLFAASDLPVTWNAVAAQISQPVSSVLRIYQSQGPSYTPIIAPSVSGSQSIEVRSIMGVVQGGADAIVSLQYNSGTAWEILAPSRVPGNGVIRLPGIVTLAPGASIRARSDVRVTWFSYGVVR